MVCFHVCSGRLSGCCMAAVRCWRRGWRRSCTAVPDGVFSCVLWTSVRILYGCGQVLETRLEEVMHSSPRTCVFMCALDVCQDSVWLRSGVGDAAGGGHAQQSPHVCFYVCSGRLSGFCMAAVRCWRRGWRRSCTAVPARVFLCVLWTSVRILYGCGQVLETRLEEVMHSSPRTCSSDVKAIDAMLVRSLPCTDKQICSHCALPKSTVRS